MTFIYIILSISCFISVFVSLSNGSLFNETIKGIITILHYIAILVLSIVSIFVGGAWYYIIIIPIASLLISWTLAFILAKTIFKNISIGRR